MAGLDVRWIRNLRASARHGPAVSRLLPPERLPSASVYMGGLLAATMVGWAAGGVAAGVVADYIGRRRTLMLSILCYAVFAGFAAISWDYWSLLIFRFLTGLGLGAEWGPGAAIVAEFWPPASRGRVGGALHAAYGAGLLLASGIWLLLNPLGPSSWRYMFMSGIIPAFLLLYVRRWGGDSDRRKSHFTGEELQVKFLSDWEQNSLSVKTMVGP